VTFMSLSPNPPLPRPFVVPKVSAWFFGVSTGHVASQTFSAQRCYTDSSPQQHKLWQFEAGHRYGDQATFQPNTGIKAWYAALLKLSAENRRNEAMRLVGSVLLPDMIVHASQQLQTSGHNISSWELIDLGHHINLGLLEPLATMLWPRVHFIRMIRSRFDTVRSFLAERKAPCLSGMWTICPEHHPDIILKLDSQTWSRLSLAQRNFWFIDEVEARWQHLVRLHPGLSRLTVRWCTAEQMKQAWQNISNYIGDLEPHNCSFHRHTHATSHFISDTELEVEDAKYRQLANYSAATRKLIRDVQRPQDCILDR